MMKKIDPSIGIKINNYLALQFLHKHTNNDEDINDCHEYLKNESKHYSVGLTIPWA